MFFLIFQNIVVGTPVCQYATAEFRCWYTGGPIRGERVNHRCIFSMLPYGQSSTHHNLAFFTCLMLKINIYNSKN